MNKLYEESLVRRIKSELAKEIHDELGNALAIVSTRIKLAKIKIEQNDTLSPDFFDQLEKTTDGLLRSTKDFIWTVASSNENPVNIFCYLKDLGEEMFEDTGIQFSAYLNDEHSLKSQLSVQQSFQIVLMFKEVLTNVIKHSQATEVYLNLDFNNQRLVLEVGDNGKGFDKKIKTIQSQNSFGLKNIEYRTMKVGGSVDISSKILQGTTVKFTLPIDQFGEDTMPPASFITGQAS